VPCCGESSQVLDRSFRQIHLLKEADEIWEDSDENAAVLQVGVDKLRLQQKITYARDDARG
jgi:hypothetical protein